MKEWLALFIALVVLLGFGAVFVWEALEAVRRGVPL
jgi:hypothetical protein